MTLHEALITALDDEYRARATYQTVLDHYGQVWPFANIVHAEERHIAALVSMFQRYGLAMPADRWTGSIVLNGSLVAECEAGVAAEIRNYQMYDNLLAQVSEPDVRMVFSNLRNVSAYHHLPAFKACVESYTGQAVSLPDASAVSSGSNWNTAMGLVAGAGFIWLLSRVMSMREY